MSTATGHGPAGGFRGERLGLPPSGRGSVAPLSSRFGAVVLDALVAYFVGLTLSVLAKVRVHGSCRTRLAPGTLCHTVAHATFVRGEFESATLLVMVALLLAVSGRTPGMLVTHLQLVRLDGRRIGWVALPRTVLMAFLFPPLVSDRDGRALHDRATGTVVVRSG